MENYVGKQCPFCKTELGENDLVKVCDSCGIPHHQSCWNENKGCTTFGCPEQHYEAQGTNPTAVCSNCGTALGDGQDFCPKCGTGKSVKITCNHCGTEIKEGQEFCPNCGQKVGFEVETEVSSAINTFNAGVTKKKALELDKKKKMYIGIAAGIVALIVIILLVSGGREDFNEMFPEYKGRSWCTIAGDGSFMEIDTNPHDDDSDDFDSYYYENYFTPANDAVTRVNKELGFSEALSQKMNSTTWNDGKQTDSNDKYEVSWTYHPDKGLEVLYELKD